MKARFIAVLLVCIAAVVRSILFRRSSGKKPLPGPPFLYSIFLMLTNSPLNFEPILVNLKARYGPIFTISFGLRTNIFIGNHSLDQKVLVQKGAVFSDRLE
ncbi:hypothetical protein R6Q57_015307 [Mikania cordata]